MKKIRKYLNLINLILLIYAVGRRHNKKIFFKSYKSGQVSSFLTGANPDVLPKYFI